ncbi:MAG: F0F1 ATP synthase subunit gamma [Bacteroides sp.]|nr:F0F1 ATP synthase subunit gamma [Bacteroides sp.]
MDFNSPLINEREVKKVGVVVYGTDDGLCGAYNLNIFKKFLEEKSRLREKYGNDVEITVMPVGKKLAKASLKLKEHNLRTLVVPGIDSKMEGGTVDSFTNSLRKDFENGVFDVVEVVYMKYLSMGKQVATVDPLYPVSREALEGEAKSTEDNKMYIFEPDANSIFNEVLPMFVLSTMQEINLENKASEQAARVMAMQAANDNAKKLLESLQLEYNKLRQQGITTELLDILGGQTGR